MPSKSKILIVDDDPQSRQLYMSLLTPFGHQVLEARDGREGLELAKQEKPDLIVSDILMPTMNGYEFVTAIRKFPSLQNVPVIFHSASFLDREARALGASCGVSLYILKPSDPERILDIVHNALGISYQLPEAPNEQGEERQTIPLLLDAFFEKGKQLDASSTRLSALLELAMNLAGPWSFTSGYTDDAIVRHGVLEPGVTFVQKPYRPKALARKIREVLGEPSTKASNHTQSALQTPINT